MASAECMGGPRAPTLQRCSSGCVSVCVLGGVAVKSNTPPANHDSRCRTNVAMYNATVQQSLTTVFPKSNLTIVMLQAEAQIVDKHNAVPFCGPLSAVHCTIEPFKKVVE
ncbi:hypothetical protein TNCV_3271901 [Trichonephila clavipes]|nr:hypothetical protein TNCV_3271901 [Trichonephila clavipes]